MAPPVAAAAVPNPPITVAPADPNAPNAAGVIIAARPSTPGAFESTLPAVRIPDPTLPFNAVVLPANPSFSVKKDNPFPNGDCANPLRGAVIPLTTSSLRSPPFSCNASRPLANSEPVTGVFFSTDSSSSERFLRSVSFRCASSIDFKSSLLKSTLPDKTFPCFSNSDTFASSSSIRLLSVENTVPDRMTNSRSPITASLNALRPAFAMAKAGIASISDRLKSSNLETGSPRSFVRIETITSSFNRKENGAGLAETVGPKFSSVIGDINCGSTKV